MECRMKGPLSPHQFIIILYYINYIRNFGVCQSSFWAYYEGFGEGDETVALTKLVRVPVAKPRIK